MKNRTHIEIPISKVNIYLYKNQPMLWDMATCNLQNLNISQMQRFVKLEIFRHIKK